MTYSTKNYKKNLMMGKKVEREHLHYYHKLKKSHKCPSDEKFTEGIAKAHISEKSDYYSRLKRAGL
jgi:hypothetical protein